MTDRMDQLLGACDRQGFEAWQTDSGAWIFQREPLTVTYHHTPVTASELLDLVHRLQAAGLKFPEED